eukprot:2568379-Pleurochrysis_carterae.AAC.3
MLSEKQCCDRASLQDCHRSKCCRCQSRLSRAYLTRLPRAQLQERLLTCPQDGHRGRCTPLPPGRAAHVCAARAGAAWPRDWALAARAARYAAGVPSRRAAASYRAGADPAIRTHACTRRVCSVRASARRCV